MSIEIRVWKYPLVADLDPISRRYYYYGSILASVPVSASASVFSFSV